MAIYFNADELPEPINEYVCWLDIMGSQNTMMKSTKISANFIFKFHTVIAKHKEKEDDDLKLYPVMDGVYITCSDQVKIKTYVKSVFTELAELFTSEIDQTHKFIVKGCLAFGPIIHARKIPKKASEFLKSNSVYASRLFVGIPMIQAHASENTAPPFGLLLHDSARAFAPVGSIRWYGKYYQWWEDLYDRQKLLKSITDHLDWCKTFTNYVDFKLDRIQYYRELAVEYFSYPTIPSTI